MKRSPDEGTHEKARALYEDALRHQGRATLAGSRLAPRHVSRRQSQAGAGEALHQTRPDPGRGEGLEEAGEGASSILAASRARVAQQKMRMATLLLVVPTAVLSVMMIATTRVVLRDWRSYESEESIARAQLGALREQLDTGQRRLSSLSSPKGREQILAEHGFIRPGDRMLLFPSEPVPQESSARASNDIAARRATRKAAPSSAWDRAARTMTGWLGHFSSAQPSPQTAPQSAPPASTSGAAATPAAEATGEAASSEAASSEAISPSDRIVAPGNESSP